jgi:hypothetical protein
MCVSIAYPKEAKSWETPEPEERYFFAVWEGGATNKISYFYSMNT